MYVLLTLDLNLEPSDVIGSVFCVFLRPIGPSTRFHRVILSPSSPINPFIPTHLHPNCIRKGDSEYPYFQFNIC
jgi:hypothetical protein